MPKKRITYLSPVDAIVELTRRLSLNEKQYGITSEDFYNQFQNGKMEDSTEFIEWANDYQHFIAIKVKLENLVAHAA